MSQYPTSPYTTPDVYPAGYGFDPMGAYLAPAKRASILMFVMGGLGLACGTCMGLVGAVGPVQSILEQGGIDTQQFGDIGMSPEQLLRMMYIIGGVMALVTSLILIVLGFFVRRGSTAAIISGIVICALGGLLMIINAFNGLWMVVRQQSATAIIGLLFVLISLGAIGLLFVWLVQAARGASSLRAARAQYQMQYWQYMQQQQMYMQQSGHGYAQAPQALPPQPPESQGA